MLSKKNPNLDVGRNSSLYFAVGLNVMLFLTWFGLEYKTYDRATYAKDILVMEEEFQEEIPVIDLNVPPPPPPPAAVTENITVVEDAKEIEETIVESTEMNLDDAIEDQVVAVEDVGVEEVEEDIEVPFAVIENVPIFPGCEKGTEAERKACFQAKIQEHVRKNFSYPPMAVELGIHGRVFVIFTINKEGITSNLKTRGPDKLLEKEAERIIASLPKMTPGKQRGRAVNVPYSIPINFILANQ
ncbi:energy transducer TonB [Aegicerativicinus sediminis]|uniref:energy transducer TonB n=1 Tax=Aegicerativicinus sediminis TaxID=2893202 RepID=UPI001E4C3671|nr:energy transducer TonB [Aegicerativicinus sediminis]